MNIKDELIEEMADAIRQDVDRTIIDAIVEKEVKALLDNGDELPDWAVEYLAEKI